MEKAQNEQQLITVNELSIYKTHLRYLPSMYALLTAVIAFEASSFLTYVTYALTLGPWVCVGDGWGCVQRVKVKKVVHSVSLTCAPLYTVWLLMTTLYIRPNLPKYSLFFNTSGSASRGESPITKTKFFWTTLRTTNKKNYWCPLKQSLFLSAYLTDARLFLLSIIFWRFSTFLCFFSDFSLAICSCVGGVYSAGFSE